MLHSKLFFFEQCMQLVPEFLYLNTYVALKDSEKQLLLDHLGKQEEQAKLKKQQSEEQLKLQQQPKLVQGKDAKKDPKAAQPKKGQPVEDKNAPKTVNIDYADLPQQNNYVIIERNYAQMRLQMMEGEQQ